MTPLFGNTVQDYYLDLVRKNYQERKARLAALKTKKDAERYAAEVRVKIQALFPFPAEKTPLNARETLPPEDFGTYRMHKVVFESRPGYPVTCNLYLPKTAEKVPGVLFLCGHSQAGKGESIYQICARALAMKGLAVLSVDPMGQGERHQFKRIPEFEGNCCREHNILNKQMILTGETFGAWRAWDAIRALDYLLSRPEIDSTRVGITGNSGGGTMTTFVNALEPRFTMAAPACYITTWLHNVENELPADGEQMPPGTFAAGLEMGDFLIARAPRPVLILGQKNDFFDPRGTRETFEEVRDFYRLLGAEDSIQLMIGPRSHGYSQENREAMCSFFTQTTGLVDDNQEPAQIPVSPEGQLFCLPEGMIDNYPGNKYLRDFIGEKADILAAERVPHTKEELQSIIREALKLDAAFVPHYRILRSQTDTDPQGDVFIYSRFALETEPDNRVMSVLKLKAKDEFFHLPQTDRATLYIPHLDSLDELREMNFHGDETIFGLDVRGIGECMPSGCDQLEAFRDFFSEYSFDYHFASLSLMFGKPYSGGRVKDILCAAELLSQTCGEINLTAKGQGAIPALLAALLSDKIHSVKLLDAPESWDQVIRMNVPGKFGLSSTIPGILRETDLPEIRSAIREKLR